MFTSPQHDEPSATSFQRNRYLPLGGSSMSQKREGTLAAGGEPLPKRLATSPCGLTEKLHFSITKPGIGPSLAKKDPLLGPAHIGHALLAPSAQTSITATDGTQWISCSDLTGDTKHEDLPKELIIPPSSVRKSMAAPCPLSPSLPDFPDVIQATQPPVPETLNETVASIDWMDMISLSDSQPGTQETETRNLPPASRFEATEESNDSASKEKTVPSSSPTLTVIDELLGGLEDDDMAGLLDNVLELPNQAPPASVVRELDADSRDGAQFDRNLQHSSPATSPAKGLKTPLESIDLLDEDVDWDAVMSIADSSHTMISSKPSAEIPASSGMLDHSISAPTPFVRPPVPSKVHDRPVITGVSSRVLLRVCFRTGELLNLNAQCQRSGQQATFELFARVTYSSREKSTKTQHFQFKDLFTDRQPYPTGTLRGWRPNSAQDRSAQVFLGSRDQTCRAICRMKKQKQGVALGWVLDVLSIRETTWDEMLWVRRIIARDDPETQTTEG